MESYMPDAYHGTPLLFAPESSSEAKDIAAAYPAMAQQIDAALETYGAVLFRGFDIPDEQAFAHIVKTIGGEVSNYVDGNSPRTKLSSGVYTSTEYPAEYFISLHNELSYAARWPAR